MILNVKRSLTVKDRQVQTVFQGTILKKTEKITWKIMNFMVKFPGTLGKIICAKR